MLWTIKKASYISLTYPTKAENIHFQFVVCSNIMGEGKKIKYSFYILFLFIVKIGNMELLLHRGWARFHISGIRFSTSVMKNEKVFPRSKKSTSTGRGKTPSSRIRYGDTVFTQLNLSTRDNLSIKRIAAPRILEGSTLYKVLINGEVAEASSKRIGDDDNVDILFDYTDKFRTCK